MYPGAFKSFKVGISLPLTMYFQYYYTMFSFDNQEHFKRMDFLFSKTVSLNGIEKSGSVVDLIFAYFFAHVDFFICPSSRTKDLVRNRGDDDDFFAVGFKVKTEGMDIMKQLKFSDPYGVNRFCIA